MSLSLEQACYDAFELGRVKGEEGLYQWASTLAVFAVMATLFVVNVWWSHEKWLAKEAEKLGKEKEKWLRELGDKAAAAAAKRTGSSPDGVDGASPPVPL